MKCIAEDAGIAAAVTGDSGDYIIAPASEV